MRICSSEPRHSSGIAKWSLDSEDFGGADVERDNRTSPPSFHADHVEEGVLAVMHEIRDGAEMQEEYKKVRGLTCFPTNLISDQFELRLGWSRSILRTAAGGERAGGRCKVEELAREDYRCREAERRQVCGYKMRECAIKWYVVKR